MCVIIVALCCDQTESNLELTSNAAAVTSGPLHLQGRYKAEVVTSCCLVRTGLKPAGMQWFECAAGSFMQSQLEECIVVGVTHRTHSSSASRHNSNTGAESVSTASIMCYCILGVPPSSTSAMLRQHGAPRVAEAGDTSFASYTSCRSIAVAYKCCLAHCVVERCGGCFVRAIG